MIIEDDLYGDLPAQYLESLRIAKTTRFVSGPTMLAYCFLAVTVCYHMMQYFDYPVLPSEAIRRIVGLNAGGILGKVQQAQSLPGVGRLLPGKMRNMENRSPPGLGNWDNSCYQNSVIQGLASLRNLPNYLTKSMSLKDSKSPATALRTIIAKLHDPSNTGLMFWTPAELKTMNSWQQQDAQEYFSKVLDEIGKEVVAGQIETRTRAGGLASLSGWQELTNEADHNSRTGNTNSIHMNNSRSFRGIDKLPADTESSLIRSPLEGLLAQRVGCLQCGYVEGLSLIPFNCLTVPLGSEWMYDIRTCLDNYTALEPISGVECVKCTLLRNKLQLERLFSQTRDPSPELSGTPLLTQALHASVKDRLSTVERALDADEFSDNSILTKCQIPANKRVSATKSRQAVVARVPKSLVIHVNRSVFDEETGMQRKNFAEVKYPLELNLAPWCLGSQSPSKDKVETVEKWSIDPSKSMHSLEAEDLATSEIDSFSSSNQLLYNLRAVITHYGRHENGHYICYRKHRLGTKSTVESGMEDSETWWCFNDEEVSKISENTVLEQGGVFMLFYEKIESAKDTKVGSSKYHDPAPACSSPKPIETSSEQEEVPSADECPSSTSISTDFITNIQQDTPTGVIENVHSESFPTNDATNVESFDNSISLIDENAKPLSPEPATIKPDDMPEKSKSPKHNHQHPPMRTASPRTNRGSVSRVGKKAMCNVSTMVIAN